MKNKIITLLALGVALPVVNLQAQDATKERPAREGRPGGQGGEGRGGRGDRPIPGIFGALDANSDRKLDKTEIAGSTEALKKLDKDSDGKLTGAELRGAMGRGPGGEGGAAGGERANREGRGSRNESEERAGQRPQGDRPAVGGGGPFVAALDANKDGSLDADELKGAPAALGKLDKNSDGDVTMEEIGVVRGRFGQGRGGEGEQPGREGRGPRTDRKAGAGAGGEQKQQ
jgi:hypothetical protein